MARLIDADALSASIKSGSGTELQKFFADVCVATAPTAEGGNMKYKVAFDGFAYVEAESPEEAKELFQNDEVVYMETEIVSAEEVDEFFVML